PGVRVRALRVGCRCGTHLVSRVLPFLVVDISLRSPLTLSSHSLSCCPRSLSFPSV
ncbi:hypothetical protein BDW22DRAFT_1364684, partial [Trametopsis cervina]